jgi:hypothetical protein
MTIPEDEYWGISDVSRYLNIARATALKLIKTEGFPVIIVQNEVRKSYRISKNAFFKWVSEHIGKTIDIKDIKIKDD